MTRTLTIFFLTFSFTTLGQTCDTIDGKLINCTDTAGLRQGYWELTKKKIIVNGYSGLGNKNGCQYFEQAEYYPLAKGHYKDGKKIGTWTYYSGDHLISLVSKITYHEDGGFKVENLAEGYVLEISEDTLVITGHFYNELDSIYIDCKEKKCVLTLSNGQELMSFSFIDLDKLEHELYRLKIGEYNREIKIKKNAR